MWAALIKETNVKLTVLTTLLLLGMLILMPPRAVAADLCELGCLQDSLPVLIPHSTSFEFDEASIPSGHTGLSGMDQETEVIEFKQGDDQVVRKRPGTSCNPSGLVCTGVRVEEDEDDGSRTLVVSVSVDIAPSGSED